ncbi:MAG: hypothetical protein N3E47_00730 [Candidatus Bathyarchaeota archaeon]|nr:hypothetical protein [Candidatus Bathyarchaeota archaeon]
MSEKNLVKVHLEFGDVKADFEGEANQVLESILRFLSQICPAIEVAQKVVYTPDLISIMSNVAGILEITDEGPIINPSMNLSAKNAICLALLGVYIGNRIGKIRKDTLSINELAKATRKARKTISNDIPKLIEDGLVEKVSEGEYRITQLGIRKSEEVIGGLRKDKLGADERR